jgi:putative flippase GtrA
MTTILLNQQERTRFFRFAIVGIFGAIVDFGTFNIMVGIIGVAAVWASVLSFTAAIINNFVWNRYWTYPDSRSKKTRWQLTQFAIISIIGLAIRTPLFAFLDDRLSALIELSRLSVDAYFIGHNLALAIAVVVVMFWNFFANRYWTYNDVD